MSLTIEKNLYINATPEKVWEMLTKPDQTEKFLDKLRVESDFFPDSVIEFKKKETEQEIVMLKGEILEAEAPKVLKYTIFDPHKGIEDVPVNYITVGYELKPENGGTELKMTVGDYSLMQGGQQSYDEALPFWEKAFKKMKKLAEA